jgi:glutamate--cysteine ligase catalytic subunit
MQRAQERNAAREQLFHFRKWVFPLGRSPSHDDWSSRPSSPSRAGFNEQQTSSVPTHDSSANGQNGTRTPSPENDSSPEVEEMTVNEVINGKDAFPGLMGVVNAYLNSLNVDHFTRCEIRKYLDLIKNRAAGTSFSYARYPDGIAHFVSFGYRQIVHSRRMDPKLYCNSPSIQAGFGRF